MTNVDRLMEAFELGEAGRQIQDFIWDEYCDWYIEMAKIRLRSGEEPSPLPVLVHVLDTALRLLHPYMPYVTEEIWSGSGDLRSHLADVRDELLMTARYPQISQSDYERQWRDEAAEREMNLVLEVVRAVRNLRRERGIDAARWLDAYVVGDVALASHAAKIEALARVRPLHIVANRDAAPSEGVATAILDGASVVLPISGLFDLEAELANLVKQRDQAQGEIERLQAQLANDRFTANAPAAVVAEARDRLEAARSRLEAAEARLKEMGR
jgi:valyl-tRNA synthetase